MAEHPKQESQGFPKGLIVVFIAVGTAIFAARIAKRDQRGPQLPEVIPAVAASVPGGLTRLRPVEVSTGVPSVRRATYREQLTELKFTTGTPGVRIFNADASDSAPRPSDDEVEGLFLTPLNPPTHAREAGSPNTVLILEGLDWNARDVALLELELLAARNCDMRLSFRTSLDRDADTSLKFPRLQYFDFLQRRSRSTQKIEIVTTGHRHWRGRVTAIRIDVLNRSTPLVLSGISTWKRMMAPGPSRTLNEEGEGIDAGLYGLDYEHPKLPWYALYEAQRSHPAVAETDLVAAFDARQPTTLCFATALAPHAGSEVGFEVWRRRGDGEPELVFETTMSRPDDTRRWARHSVELVPGGESDLLWLRTRGGEEGELVGLWGLLAVQDRGAPPLSSVILITADTLRADHVGAYGATEVETPVIDALAERGVVFIDSLAVGNSTSPSHASLLTGVFPKDHGVEANHLMLPEGALTIAEQMAASGRLTLASSAVRHLNSAPSGFGQGMDIYLDTPPPFYQRERVEGQKRDPEPVGRAGHRSAPVANRQLFDVLRELGDTPKFLWLHYYDPHTPYEPDAEFEDRYRVEPTVGPEAPALLERFAQERLASDPDLEDIEAARRAISTDAPFLYFLGDESDAEKVRSHYRAEVAQFDRDLGELFGFFKSDSFGLDDALVVFTADHGEALGEREIWFDHHGLYDNTLRVPLIFAGPGIPSGVRVAEPASGVDVVPTIGELLGWEPIPNVRGLSLARTWSGEPLPERERWFQYANGLEAGYRTGDTHAVLPRRDHLRSFVRQMVREGAIEVYDAAPGAQLGQDLSSADPDRAAAAVERVQKWLADRLLLGRAKPAELGQADRENLKALGYTGGD